MRRAYASHAPPPPPGPTPPTGPIPPRSMCLRHATETHRAHQLEIVRLVDGVGEGESPAHAPRFPYRFIGECVTLKELVVVVGCAQVLRLLPVLFRCDRLAKLRRVHANRARILWSPLGSGRADLLILILSVAVIFQPHCPVPNSCCLPFPLISMDSKQATRKVSGQAVGSSVICNRKKIVRKNKDVFNFLSKKLSLTLLRIQDPGSGAFLGSGIRNG
jgi:hypothetical protein